MTVFYVVEDPCDDVKLYLYKELDNAIMHAQDLVDYCYSPLKKEVRRHVLEHMKGVDPTPYTATTGNGMFVCRIHKVVPEEEKTG